MMSKEAMKLALEALELAQDNLRDHSDNCFLHDEGEYNRCFCGKDSLSDHLQSVVEKLDEALAEQPAQQEPERVKFERHWKKTRGEKKANRELPRHPLQPQTYIQDSANRHWVTWQAAVRSVAPSAQRKPLTDEQRERIAKGWRGRNWTVGDIIDATEAAHGIKENT
jgi:hypothetical protein